MSPEEFEAKLAQYKALGEQIDALTDERRELSHELAVEKCPHKAGDLVEITKRRFDKTTTKQYRVKMIKSRGGRDPLWRPEVFARLIKKDGTESESLTNITWDMDSE